MRQLCWKQIGNRAVGKRPGWTFPLCSAIFYSQIFFLSEGALKSEVVQPILLPHFPACVEQTFWVLASKAAPAMPPSFSALRNSESWTARLFRFQVVHSSICKVRLKAQQWESPDLLEISEAMEETEGMFHPDEGACWSLPLAKKSLKAFSVVNSFWRWAGKLDARKP